MNLKFKIGFCFLLLSLFCAFAQEEGIYKVIKVIDGDSVYIDFNKNNIADLEERVRLNGVDAFEISKGYHLNMQMKYYNLSEKDALYLGFLGKKFAQERLLGQFVYVKFSGNEKTDSYGRKIVSVYYGKNFSKNFEEAILKEGLAVVYRKSNLARDLKKFENMGKIKKNLENL